MIMPSRSTSVLLVIGNLAKDSTTRRVLQYAERLLLEKGCEAEIFDPAVDALPLFNVETAFSNEAFLSLKKRVNAADVFILGTPDYHGSMSSAIKNFLDHFWKEYAGKLFVSVVGSYEKGLTVHDQIRTVARQCYAWSLPYGVSFHEKDDFDEAHKPSEALSKRLQMMVSDVCKYGNLLAEQRRNDLHTDGKGFLAHYRT